MTPAQRCPAFKVGGFDCQLAHNASNAHMNLTALNGGREKLHLEESQLRLSEALKRIIYILGFGQYSRAFFGIEPGLPGFPRSGNRPVLEDGVVVTPTTRAVHGPSHCLTLASSQLSAKAERREPP